jgi:hypothetical protein
MGDQPGDRKESRMTCKSYDIPKTLIWEAWLHVKANQGAAGIDGETKSREQHVHPRRHAERVTGRRRMRPSTVAGAT